MKTILGLDLGTSSIGWALVKEAENEEEKSSIIKLGVRVNPLTVDEQSDFEKGKSITTNASRTLKRSMRRNLQRYKLRRENLIELLKEYKIITNDTILAETGNQTTFETFRLRAKAATDKISLEDFARVLLMINKKRGYKSSRKAKSAEEGQLLDGMDVALKMYNEDLTPGQLAYSILKEGKRYIPDFYRSDLETEFDKIWDFQKSFYPEILTDELKKNLNNKNEKQTWAICKEPFNIVGVKRVTKGQELIKENYQWRSVAFSEKLGLEELAIVLQKINGQLKNASGYLGNISDRSKELFFKKLTVGQYQMIQLDKNPNYSLKNQVFYRQDYLDEFETIWETQAKYHNVLTPELKKEIRDIVIFYQRSLKSQKGLISLCEFESRKINVKGKEITIGPRVCPKSSPIFQEFKIWQILNNLSVSYIDNPSGKRGLTIEEKQLLFNELNIKGKLAKKEVINLLFKNQKNIELNFKDIEGNRTQSLLFNAYKEIIDISGNGEYDYSKMTAKEILDMVTRVFKGLQFNTNILTFDSGIIDSSEFQSQDLYKLWHLLYSYEGDNSKTGNESLITKLMELCKMRREYASILANVTFGDDYGNLSTKALRKILPYMKEGEEYSVACAEAGYRHSKASLTSEELENKVYADALELLPRNSLRNPVVEKILNQMINVVNSIIATYGKPDEIRIELARELKKNAKERADLTMAINASSIEHEKYKEILKTQFGLVNISRNDIIRYKLYLELEPNGFKTLYSNTYISPEELFSKKFDIEHIIPQSKLFDDSFSNKTLEARAVNIEKSNMTAFDYVLTKSSDGGADYKGRIEKLYKIGAIGKAKHDKLLLAEPDIKSGFIERDLRDSQYIAKKAREILQTIVKFVVPTTGSITDRLRQDWQLVDVMKELNWDKYDKLGLTEIVKDNDGRDIKRIVDWTKRNDHRHHAMDALTIAFTKPSYIQYLNNLNARSDKSSSIRGIEMKELSRDSNHKLRFIPPIQPLGEFRAEAKRQLENVIISIKAKNKVATINTNVSKKQKGTNKVKQLTPRGQLHKETVYAQRKQYVTQEVKVGGNFDAATIAMVANKKYRVALAARLESYEGNAKKAFTGKNSLEKNPIYLDVEQTEKVPEKVKISRLEDIYTIRKSISPDLKLDKVLDGRVRRLLQARLDEFGGDPKKAFINLDENPIWQDEERGVALKRVTITAISTATPLHQKCDNKGELVLDENGDSIPCDYISTGNNHHVAIYCDAKGDFQEKVVSFFEATARVNQGLPVVDKVYNSAEGWNFLFTMKQNEYFVFPDKETGFNPNEIDLTDPANYSLISPHLFRVQQIATKDYMFRHHLETTVINSLQNITYFRLRTPNGLKGIVKVRVNHIGEIVSVGEY